MLRKMVLHGAPNMKFFTFKEDENKQYMLKIVEIQGDILIIWLIRKDNQKEKTEVYKRVR